MPAQLRLVQKPVKTAREHVREKLADFSLRQAERDRRRQRASRPRAALPDRQLKLALE